MRKFIVVAAMLVAAPALASDLSMGSQLGSTMDAIETSLVDMGYEVRKMEMEDGKIEAYAVKDGKMSEIYVDPSSGEVTDLETK